MNINEIKKEDCGKTVSNLRVICSNKSELLFTSNGNKYFNVTLKDKTGEITSPVFDEELYGKYKEGCVYTVSASVNTWKDNIQLKNIIAVEIPEGEYDPTDFIDKYPQSLICEASSYIEMTIDQLQQPYKDICCSILLDSLGHLKDCYLKCPSAAKHHGNKLGGWLIHTCGVIENVISMYHNYDVFSGERNQLININRLVCKAILHDAAKIYEYEYDTYIRRKENTIGHIYDGISIVDATCRKLDISEETRENLKMCILSHHGKYGPHEPENIEDMLVHLADMVDSRMIGAIEGSF